MCTGGTYRLLSKVFVPWGVGLDVVDITDLKAVETALASKHYQYVWVETPSNPLLNITDIAATTEVAHKYGTKVAVDNTFASPALQHPLAMAPMWWSTPPPSTSAATPTWSAVPWWSTMRRPARRSPSCRTPPAQCPPVRLLLDIRGLKTLDLRVKRHSANALKVAEWLESQPLM